MSFIPGHGEAGGEAVQVCRLGRTTVALGVRQSGALRRGVIGLIAALFLSLSALPAWACSCLSSEPDDFVAGVGIVFRGALISEQRVPPSLQGNCKGAGLACQFALTGTFRVEQVFKGTAAETVNITYAKANGGNCGASFRVGHVVLIAADGDAERGYSTGMCTLVQVSDDAGAAAILAAADRYRSKLATLDAAVAANPSDVRALLSKARFLADSNARIEAVATLDRLLQLEPLQRDATLLKADLLSLRARATTTPWRRSRRSSRRTRTMPTPCAAALSCSSA